MELDWGTDSPLRLELAAKKVADLRGPAGIRGERAADRVRAALASPVDVPALSSHVVPGDRVTIVIAGELAQEEVVVAAAMEAVCEGGVAAQDVKVLRSVEFANAEDSRTAYLAADDDANPIHLAREIIDADAVVTVGEWNWDASLAGRSIDGELFPAFARKSVREALLSRLLHGPSEALGAWRRSLDAVTQQLGLLASLRVVPGMNNSVAAAVFGTPRASRLAAREAAGGWRPAVADFVDLSIASLHETAREAAHEPSDGGRHECVTSPPGFEQLVRGVAAAARVTATDGTICVASRLNTTPGPVFGRWRQGAPLRPLLREAAKSGDAALVADAFLARRFQRALGDRRLVLLSGLDQEAVEDLGFGHAESPETVLRLAKAARRVAVLHEADRLLPSIGD